MRSFTTFNNTMRSMSQGMMKLATAEEACTAWATLLPADIRADFTYPSAPATRMNWDPADPRPLIQAAYTAMRNLLGITEEEWNAYASRILGPAGAGETWAKRRAATEACRLLLTPGSQFYSWDAKRIGGDWAFEPKKDKEEKQVTAQEAQEESKKEAKKAKKAKRAKKEKKQNFQEPATTENEKTDN